MHQGTCEYVFDPSDIDIIHPDVAFNDEELSENGVWKCPHDSFEGYDRCVAHLEEIPEGVNETDWLLETVELGSQYDSYNKQRKSKQFIGANFDNLDLASSTVSREDSFILDFRFADINSLHCVSLDLTHHVNVSMSTISSLSMDGDFDLIRGLNAEIQEVELNDTEIKEVDFRDADLGNVFLESSILQRVDIRNSDINSIEFSEASVRRGYFNFCSANTARAHHATFDVVDFDNAAFGSLDFYYSDFGEADFRNVAAVKSVFKGTEFDGAYFNGADLEVTNWIGADIRSGYFTDVSFEEASFRKSTIDSAKFRNCFFGWVNFQDAEFEKAKFQGSVLEQGSFRNAEFVTANFTEIDCAGVLNLKETVFEEYLDIKPEPIAQPYDSLIDLSGSEISKGTLSQSDSGRVIYDLEGATIGKVHFVGEETDMHLINKIRFLRTRFENFDFRDNDDIILKRVNYNIHNMFEGAESLAGNLREYGILLSTGDDHTVPIDPIARPQNMKTTDPYSQSYQNKRENTNNRLINGEIEASNTPSYDNPRIRDLEYTYLLAKNGANEIHDNESSSMFFIREMKQRRKMHAKLASEGENWKEKVSYRKKWMQNFILGMTAEYGESPTRVIYTSVGTVIIFGVLYLGIKPSLYENILDFFVLSIGSFVTLVIGGVGDIEVTGIRLLTQIEAFVGGFLIAMFVFTLTRSIHR